MIALPVSEWFCGFKMFDGGISIGGKVMAALLKRLYLGEEGQGLVEYSLILALIAAMCFVAVREFGVMVKGLYEKVTF